MKKFNCWVDKKSMNTQPRGFLQTSGKKNSVSNHRYIQLWIIMQRGHMKGLQDLSALIKIKNKAKQINKIESSINIKIRTEELDFINCFPALATHRTYYPSNSPSANLSNLK